MAPNTTSAQTTSPNEQLLIPKWINEDYFQKVLEKDIPNYSKIVKFSRIAATAPGENYTSVMVRVHMDVQLKDGTITQTSYILKTMLDPENKGFQLVNSMNLFPKEKKIYQTILPTFLQLYEAAGAALKLGPKCLHIDETPENITLVMEDLKRQNFVNIDRLKGFDMAHMTCVLQKLAEFHAASVIYEQLNGPYDDMFNRSFWCEANRPMYEALAGTHHVQYIKAMRTWGLDNIEYYISKIPNPMQMFDESLRLNSYDPNEFNVLNHGDSWANNIMFNYKANGEIDEALFVDFQVSKWGSPAQDLWYLIISSAALDIKTKEFDHFVSIYHKRLVECLKLLQYDKHIPTLRELHIQMLKYGFWGYHTATTVLTVVLLPSDTDSNMDSMLKPGPEGEEFRYKIFSNKYYGRAMCTILPFIDNKGILDIA